MLDGMTNTAGARTSTPRANEIVAANVRAQLGYAKITQAQLAASLGQDAMWISRRMKSNPSFSTDELQAVADYFEMTPGEFFVEQSRRPIGGGNGQIVGIRVARSWRPLVGPTGLEPMTSTVESGRLAPVTPIGRRAA